MIAENPHRVQTLLERLIHKTRSEELAWRPTLRESAFVSVVNRGGFEIERLVDRPMAPGGDESAIEYYELTIMDRDGHVADRYSSQPDLSGADTTHAPADALGKLYRLARCAAMSTDSLVDELISELA